MWSAQPGQASTDSKHPTPYTEQSMVVSWLFHKNKEKLENLHFWFKSALIVDSCRRHEVKVWHTVMSCNQHFPNYCVKPFEYLLLQPYSRMATIWPRSLTVTHLNFIKSPERPFFNKPEVAHGPPVDNYSWSMFCCFKHIFISRFFFVVEVTDPSSVGSVFVFSCCSFNTDVLTWGFTVYFLNS